MQVAWVQAWMHVFSGPELFRQLNLKPEGLTRQKVLSILRRSWIPWHWSDSGLTTSSDHAHAMARWGESEHDRFHHLVRSPFTSCAENAYQPEEVDTGMIGILTLWD
jgi:hypothetical protein